MKKHTEYTVDITSLSHEGRGIGPINGKTTFVNAALPHEKVVCLLTKTHSRFNEADVKEILIASPDRATAPCPHFSICGGCSLQHMNVDAQLKFKQGVLLEQLQHFGNIFPETILPPIQGNSLGYRRKARLGVRYVRKKEKVLVGFREKNSNFLADIKACIVLHEKVGTRLTEISELIASLSQFDHIAQIEVAIGDHDAALVFRHLTDLSKEDLEKLSQFGKQHHLHIYLQPNPPAPITKLWPQDQNLFLTYELPDYQLSLQFHPLDFVQINQEINLKMIPQALALLDLQSTDHVLDLFCGLGNFTLPLARYAKHVTGIEGSKDMIERAKKNAERNHIVNVDFHVANLMESLPATSWAHRKYDKILLDPPRTGAKEIIPHLRTWEAKKIVYVSCNPATFARDAGLLAQEGYQLTSVGIMNMFSHTSHVEAMGLFEKKNTFS